MKNIKSHSKSYFYKIMIVDALALFAMFFGAGNMLFPLEVGVHGGGHFWLNWLGFVLTGVGIPMIGLWANQLFQGDYEKLFSYIGRIPKDILIGLIILIIGPMFGAPRTETVTFASLKPFLPHMTGIHPIVSFIYFVLIFYIARKPGSLVDIVGEILSPIKVGAFLLLIALAVFTNSGDTHHYPIMHHSFFHAMNIGYETMDLFSAIFFGSIIYLNVKKRSEELNLSESKTSHLAAMSSVIGMAILIVIYTGLMFSAHKHAHALHHVADPRLIEALSAIVLGKYGAIFVAACITLACLATASALAEVTTDFFQHTVFRNKVSRMPCLTISVVWMYAMSLLGFDGIMKILEPILNIIYPLIALYTLIMCLYMTFKKKAC
jgi:LIVCS family branched-chain amino acid:cation transporter